MNLPSGFAREPVWEKCSEVAQWGCLMCSDFEDSRAKGYDHRLLPMLHIRSRMDALRLRPPAHRTAQAPPTTKEQLQIRRTYRLSLDA